MISYKDRIFDKNIIDVIQDRVNELRDRYWKDDKCKPEFIVSILFDYEYKKGKKEQYIILTCRHLNSSFSSLLFPKYENVYGYDSLLEEMQNLYNKTM